MHSIVMAEVLTQHDGEITRNGGWMNEVLLTRLARQTKY